MKSALFFISVSLTCLSALAQAVAEEEVVQPSLCPCKQSSAGCWQANGCLADQPERALNARPTVTIEAEEEELSVRQLADRVKPVSSFRGMAAKALASPIYSDVMIADVISAETEVVSNTSGSERLLTRCTVNVLYSFKPQRTPAGEASFFYLWGGRYRDREVWPSHGPTCNVGSRQVFMVWDDNGVRRQSERAFAILDSSVDPRTTLEFSILSTVAAEIETGAK